MKLINNTRIPDAILESVLVRAAKSIGSVRTAGVVVQVNRALPLSRIHGMAYECVWVRWTPRSRRKLTTDGGAFRISLPLLPASTTRNNTFDKAHYNPLDVAEWFFQVARHEWGHIRDYQRGGRFLLNFSRRVRGGRRPRHDRRPEEIRTENYAYEADSRGRGKEWAYEEIMALAIAMESSRA